MAPKPKRSKQLKNIGYELFIGAMSVLSILNMVLAYFFRTDESLVYVIDMMNAIMMPIFLGDFIYRLMTSHPKSEYFVHEYGWADLLSSLPFPHVKILRVFRLWRVIRLVRKFGVKNLGREYIDHRADNALLTVLFLVVCVLQFGSLAVLSAEKLSPDSNIKNASDALWWVYVTITTVGYGDRFPVTNAGRLAGVFVLTAGVGLFGTLSGFVANAFLAPPRKKEQEETDSTEVDDHAAKLAEIVHMVEAQEEVIKLLKTKLAELGSTPKTPV